MRKSWDSKSPSLLPAFICYADILGFSDLIKQAFRLGEEEKLLERIQNSVSAAYRIAREAATFDRDEPPFFGIKVFTDNILIASPLLVPNRDYGEPELGYLLAVLSEVQASLAADGFLLRGAITVGRHYQDRDIAFGEALLEAVKYDKSGGPPKLVLAPSVESRVSKHLSWYGDGNRTTHHSHLLEDPQDGRLFVNYLAAAYQFFPDGPVDYKLFEQHGEVVRKGLREYEHKPKIHNKYVWLASYHNFVCQMFAEDFQDYSGEWADSHDAAVGVEAHRALDYLVAVEAGSEVRPPRPLDARRLRHGLNPF